MRMLRRNANWIATPLLLAALIWIWDIYVQAFEVSPLVLPRPVEVWESKQQLLTDPRTLNHVWTTLYETLAGFAIAILVGVGLGAVLGKVRWLERTLNPFIVGLQVMPKIALVPLFIIWFGFGPTSKIVMAAVLAFFPIMTNTILGIKSVDRGHRDVMISLNATRWQSFRDMELPNALPYILTGMEVGIVLAIIGAIVGEYLGGSTGLGYLAVATLNAFDVQGMFAVIGLLTIIGFILYFAVVMLRRFVTPWHEAVLVTRQQD
ncbi:MAG: ABC transporter permease [Alphaproteobacteria bacterium]|nr:ABC transporter permease [Alphaproteobacteria bacterium]